MLGEALAKDAAGERRGAHGVAQRVGDEAGDEVISSKM
jgi:hypothetical protein